MKPGELRILKALAKGKPLGNIELAGPADIKNSTIRSRYLKNLRKQGLIIKDIDTRKYKLIARGREQLFLIDLMNLMKDRIDLAASVGLEDAGIGWWQAEFVISEDPSIPVLVKDLLHGGTKEGSEIRLALSKVLNLVDGVWRRKTLESFNVEEGKVIEDYMKKLSDAAWLIYGDNEDVDASVVVRQKRILGSLCPDVKALKKTLTDTDRIFTESTYAELNAIVAYLEEPDRRKLYEGYLKTVRSCPKTLIITPSSAFRDYLKKYQDIFP